METGFADQPFRPLRHPLIGYGGGIRLLVLVNPLWVNNPRPLGYEPNELPLLLPRDVELQVRIDCLSW